MKEPFAARYVALCGQESCIYCQGSPGTNGQVWPDRMCQYGSEALAEQGKDYRTILKSYYSDIEFSDEEEPVPDTVNDATEYGVVVYDPVDMKAGDKYWQAVKVHHLTPQENNGQHNVFVSVLDGDGNRINGAVVKGWWGPSAAESGTVVQDKPPTDIGGCNFVLNSPAQTMSVCVLKPEPVKSQVVGGMNTAHPDEPPVTGWGHPGNTTGHHSYLVEFQVAVWGGEPEPPEPPEPPVTEKVMRVTEQSDTRIVIELVEVE